MCSGLVCETQALAALAILVVIVLQLREKIASIVFFINRSNIKCVPEPLGVGSLQTDRNEPCFYRFERGWGDMDRRQWRW